MKTNDRTRPRRRPEAVLGLVIFGALGFGALWAMLSLSGEVEGSEYILTPVKAKDAELGSEPIAPPPTPDEEQDIPAGCTVEDGNELPRESELVTVVPPPVSRIETILGEAEEQGLLGIAPDGELLDLLLAIEKAIRDSDQWLHGRLVEKLHRRLQDDPQAMDFLLGLVESWPLEPSRSSKIFDSLLKTLLGAGNEEDRSRFGEAMKRREERIFSQRMKDPELLVELFRSAADPGEKLRALQLLTGDELGAEAVRDAVRELALIDPAAELRRSAVQALMQASKSTENVDFLLDVLVDESDPSVRYAAIRALGYQRDQRVTEQLAQLIDDDDPVVRNFAAAGIGRQTTDPLGTRALIDAFHEETTFSVQINLVRALGKHAAAADVEQALLDLVGSDAADDLRALAAGDLWRGTSPEIEPTLQRLLEDPNPSVRRQAERAHRVFLKRTAQG